MTKKQSQGNGPGQVARFVRKLFGDTRASTLPIMAAAIIPTMAMIGGGIDFGRAYLAQSKLQGAVDAGALAAVRAKQSTSNTNSFASQIGKDYIKANFPAGYLGAQMAEEKVEVTDVNNLVKAEVTAAGSVRTTLLSIVGIDSLPFSAQATAEASDTLPTSVEALLVLDNTGSMRGSRMRNLKTAAKNFVDVIYGDNNQRDGFGVGILPYNTMVNVGRLVRSHNSSMVKEYRHYTDVNPNTDPLGWKGCLFADPTVRNISTDPYTVDTGAYDIDDTMPGENGMPPHEPFIYPPIFVDSFQDVNNRYKVPFNRRRIFEIPTVKEAMVRRFGPDICTNRNGNGKRDCTQDESSYVDIERLPEEEEDRFEDPKYYNHYSGESQSASPNNIWGASPNYQCPSEALPISYGNTRDSLKAYVDEENYALRPGTGTFHNIAMTWAYRMMSRNDVFPRDRPSNIPVKRVVIFMSDGNFDSRDDGRTPSGGGSKVPDTAYTAYKTYEDRIMISGTSRNDTIDNLIPRFAKTCEAMKEDGIEIYTIAFEISNNSQGDRTREMFRNCATDRNTHFFAATNGASLNEAFVTIASELVNLRLTR